MDPTRFDALTCVLGEVRGRRQLITALAALPLVGMITGISTDDIEAEQPRDRLRRRKAQRRRKQRNRKQQNQNNTGSNGNNKNGANKKNKNKGGGLGGSQCAATGSDCTQDSDCCSNNCLNLGCADKVHSCGSGNDAKACHPAANGCAGETCCYGAAVCGATCCAGTANQCNQQGECCAPNCAGRLCGPDGCGGGGTCGACPSGTTCNGTTGQCTCTPQCQGKTCGPDGCGGFCGSCLAGQLCDEGTCQTCDVCASGCAHTAIQPAIDAAMLGGAVRICPGSYTVPPTGLGINKNLTLVGAGLGAGGAIIDGMNSARDDALIQVADGFQVALRDLTITGGNGTDGGGALFVMEGATVDLTRVLISKSTAFAGGGILNQGTLTLNAGTTVTLNSANYEPGGGIANNGTLTLNEGSAVTNNQATTSGGGIANGERLTLNPGSTLSGNLPDNCRNFGSGTGCP